MIAFPTTIEAAARAGADASFRAGATDLHERQALGLATGPIVDLRDVGALAGIVWDGGSARIGATTTIATIAADPQVLGRYPALAAAAAALATPQIRAVGTIGGNLLQRTRCWYYRSPEAHCLKKGGDRCWARGGDHLLHACFDVGPCASVHPSTLALALLAHDGVQIDVHGQTALTIEALMGDGSDPRRDHQLPDGTLLTAIRMPPPTPGERAAYFRTISRARAEWPLVEALVRLVVGADDRIAMARGGIGGVAAVPLRRPATERALEGQPVSAETLERAAALAREGAAPLPMTGYKVDLVEGTVLEALERATHATPTATDAPPAAAAPTDAAP